MQCVVSLQTLGTPPLDLRVGYEIPQSIAKSGGKGARSHIPPLDLAIVCKVSHPYHHPTSRLSGKSRLNWGEGAGGWRVLVFQPLIFDNQPNPYQKPIYITNHCPTNGKTGHFRPVSIRNGGYVLPTTTQPMAKLAISGQCRSETVTSVGWIFCPPLRLIQNSNNMIVDTFKKKKKPCFASKATQSSYAISYRLQK